MSRSLAFRFTLGFLLVSLAGISLVAFFSGRVTASEFGHFMMMQDQSPQVEQLTEYYRTHGSWDGVDELLGGPGPMMMGGGFALADQQGEVIAAGGGHHHGDHLSAPVLAQGVELIVEGETVGTLLPARGRATSPAAADFLVRVNRALALAALGTGVLTVILGVVLARALTQPIGELMHATRAIAQGKLGHQVTVRTRDELGELATAFNHMSADLARARDQRRQLTADIAHDLRTPLSIILGHAEALRDGVLPPTPETFALIHDEAQHLNRLIEDLRTLSLAEAGELTLTRRPTAPGALLERAVAAQMPRALQQQLTLHADFAQGLPEINVDPDRMAQVLGNILDNALRHTPAGGRVVCGVAGDARGGIIFSITDTGPGIAPDDLPYIFDRFYRADKARARQEQGGSGLGLAIAKSLTHAHGGKIWAENAPDGGARFIIQLPVVNK